MRALIPVSAVAEMLGCKEWLVRKLIHEGKLRSVNLCVRATRVYRSSVLEYLESKKEERNEFEE